jgi:hypothetical protein
LGGTISVAAGNKEMMRGSFIELAAKCLRFSARPVVPELLSRPAIFGVVRPALGRNFSQDPVAPGANIRLFLQLADTDTWRFDTHFSRSSIS